MKACMTRLKSPSDVDRLYAPSLWGYAMQHAEKAYTADCPTLADIAATFGAEYAAMWIRGQVLALYGASSNRDAAVSNGIKPFADSFAPLANPYKLSELMLFFARYKAGVYDNSYATFDTRRIGNAFFREFLPQRAAELAAIEHQAAMESSLRRRELPEGYVVPEGYNPASYYRTRVTLGEIPEYGNLKRVQEWIDSKNHRKSIRR